MYPCPGLLLKRPECPAAGRINYNLVVPVGILYPHQGKSRYALGTLITFTKANFHTTYFYFSAAVTYFLV